MKKNYNNDIYKAYEEEYLKNEKLMKKIKYLKLDNSVLRDNYNR